MAEVEFAGVKFKGGKMIAVIMALSTLVGGLYGAFEVYKDYMDMKEQISKYVAPDLSGFEKKVAIVQEEMKSLKTEVQIVSDVNKDLKVDLKGDIRRIEKIVEDVETRVKEDSREWNTTIRGIEKDTDQRLKAIEKDVDTKIKRALNNPLANPAISN
ncbi:MAG: hypothetical protein EBY41_00120 [Proteobacteria bacterium]|nr:hypothetical protein [Pseudomonadota bacterium]